MEATLNTITAAPVTTLTTTLHLAKDKQVTKTPITAYHRALFACAFKHANLVAKAEASQKVAVSNTISAKYNGVAPTWAEFKVDRAALKALSAERGLASDQYIRKTYNACILALYGALPVSDSPNAKRQPKSAKGNAKTKKGAALSKDMSPADIIGQIIATFGIGSVLSEMSKILATDNKTRTDAKALSAIASHFVAKAA